MIERCIEPDMNEKYDADGKWLGTHVSSCQREKCKNPKGSLINCFSCERAFCKPCWKKVSNMLAGMKSAKGFQHCSIDPRPQVLPQPIPGHELLHQEHQAREPSVQAVKLANSRQQTLTELNGCITVIELDDSEDETVVHCSASATSPPKDSSSNVMPTRESQQSEPSVISSKRPHDDSMEDIAARNAKCPKLTSPILSLPASNKESFEPTSVLEPHPSRPICTEDGQVWERIVIRYGSDGSGPSQQYFMQQTSLAQKQHKQNLTVACGASEGMDSGMSGDASDLDKERRTNQRSDTRDSGDDDDDTEDENDIIRVQSESASDERSNRTSSINPRSSSTTPCLSKTAPTVSRPPTRQGHTTLVQDQIPEPCPSIPCDGQQLYRTQREPSTSHNQPTFTSISNQARIVPQVHHIQGPEVLAVASNQKSLSSQSSTPTASGIIQHLPVAQSSIQAPQGVSSCPPRIGLQPQHMFPAQNHLVPLGDSPSGLSSGMTSDKNGGHSNITQQSPQYQSMYHTHQIPHTGPLPCEVQKPCPPSISTGSSLSSSTFSSSSQTRLDAQSLEKPGPRGLPIASQMPNPDQRMPRQMLPQSSHYHPHTTPFTYAFTELDIEHLPANQKKIGDGWSVLYNPHVQRALDISLQHTFHFESLVSCIRFSPNGKYVAAGGNRFAQIVDAISGLNVCVLRIEPGSLSTRDIYVRSLCFSPDGQFLVTASDDMLIRIWDIQSSSVQHILTGHEGDIFSLDIARTRSMIASGSADRTVRIWDIETGSQTLSISTEREVAAVVFSLDANFVAVACLDTCVRVWDTRIGTLVRWLDNTDGHKISIFSIALSPNGKHLITGSLDRTLKMWDLLLPGEPGVAFEAKAGKCVQSFEGHDDIVLSVAFSPDGEWVLSGSKDKGVHFWNPRTGISQLRINAHRDSVLSVASSPTLTADGGLFATASADFQAKIWSYTKITSQQVSQTLANTQLTSFGQPITQKLLPPPTLTPAIRRPTSQFIDISRPERPFGHPQGLFQQPPLPRMLHKPPIEVIQTSGTSRAAFQTPKEPEPNSHFIVRSSGSETIAAHQDGLPYPQLFRQLRSFASQAPEKLRGKLQKVQAYKGTHPECEELFHAYQQELEKKMNKRTRQEAVYEEILEDLSGEDREKFLLIMNRGRELKRQQLQEFENETLEKLKPAREIKAEAESLAKILGDLKNCLPGTISVTQDLLACVVSLEQTLNNQK